MGQRNEGEGNKTAAKEYNKETTEFAKSARSKPRRAKPSRRSTEKTATSSATRNAKANRIRTARIGC